MMHDQRNIKLRDS